MKVYPFKAWHMKLLTELWHDTGALTSILAEQPGYAVALEQAGPGYSGFTDAGEYLGSCGIYTPWRGSGEMWAVLDAAVQRHKFAFHRFVKSRLAMECERMGLHRLQAIVDAECERSKKWALSLGFTEPPCLMRAFGPNHEDYILMARLF